MFRNDPTEIFTLYGLGVPSLMMWKPKAPLPDSTRLYASPGGPFGLGWSLALTSPVCGILSRSCSIMWHDSLMSRNGVYERANESPVFMYWTLKSISL